MTVSTRPLICYLIVPVACDGRHMAGLLRSLYLICLLGVNHTHELPEPVSRPQKYIVIASIVITQLAQIFRHPQ